MGKSSNVPGEVIVPEIIIIKNLKSSIVFGRFLIYFESYIHDTALNIKVSNIDLWCKI